MQSYTFILSFILVIMRVSFLGSYRRVPAQVLAVESHLRILPKGPGFEVPLFRYAVFLGLPKDNCLNEIGEILFWEQW